MGACLGVLPHCYHGVLNLKTFKSFHDIATATGMTEWNQLGILVHFALFLKIFKLLFCFGNIKVPHCFDTPHLYSGLSTVFLFCVLFKGFFSLLLQINQIVQVHPVLPTTLWELTGLCEELFVLWLTPGLARLFFACCALGTKNSVCVSCCERISAGCVTVSRMERRQNGVARWDVIWTVIVENVLVLIWLCNSHNPGQLWQGLQGDKGEGHKGLGIIWGSVYVFVFIGNLGK